jgi:hypothetical protein
VSFDNVQYPLRIYKHVLCQVATCVSHIQIRNSARLLHTTLEFKQEGGRVTVCCAEGATKIAMLPDLPLDFVAMRCDDTNTAEIVFFVSKLSV